MRASVPTPGSAARPSTDADAVAFAAGTAATPAADDDAVSLRSRHTLQTLNGKRSDSSYSIHFDQQEDSDPWQGQDGRGSAVVNGTLPTQFMDPAERRQLLIRAGLQLLALFFVCLVGLGGTLWLALPVIDEADRPAFKVPRSFEQLQDLNKVLQHYKDENFAQVMLCWFIVYMFLQAFSIPGSMYMSILAGALWGVPLALPLVCASVATGATICYLISKFLGVVLLALPSWKVRVDSWKEKLAQHNDNMLSYLIVIRMMPLPPHNIVNILAPHLGINLGLFWLSTFCGIFAVSVIHTTIGEKLDQMTSADDFNLFSWRNVLLLGGVCIAVLIPVAVRKMNTTEALEEVEDRTAHGPVRLEIHDDYEPDRLPPSFSATGPQGPPGRTLVGRGRTDARYSDDDAESDDELPPMAGMRVDGMESPDENVRAWRDPTVGSRIGEEGFREDDGSPMFADREGGSGRPVARGASSGSVSERVKSWWSRGG